MAKILLVEDDIGLSTEIVSCLQAIKMTVDRVSCLSQAEMLIESSRHDLIILDWNLPDGNGPDLLKEVRRKGDLRPVIMLTARTTVAEKVQGLETGADDYLTKPFAFPELIARVTSLLRRPRESNEDTMVVGDLVLNSVKCSVEADGVSLDLRRREYQILELLIKNRGKLFNVQQIIDKLWASDLSVDAEVVRCHVNRLRHKLGERKNLITTVYGKGYKVE
jgi:DNA-binding response OmpR family regulator